MIFCAVEIPIGTLIIVGYVSGCNTVAVVENVAEWEAPSGPVQIMVMKNLDLAEVVLLLAYNTNSRILMYLLSESFIGKLHHCHVFTGVDFVIFQTNFLVVEGTTCLAAYITSVD